MFFGMGWALTSLVALNYFQSMIIPQTFGGWFYFFLTYVGHYGVLLSLVYFLLYCPVVAIFPTYYFSRLWSVFLLLSLNVLIFLDSHLFSKYRFHLNSFLFDLLKEGNGKDVIGLSKAGFIVLGCLVFAVFLVLWIRGEWLWRSMQARFSNPVKNWYLAIILICFTGSHLFHVYGDAKGAKNITKVSSLFPMNFPLTSKEFLKSRGLVSEENFGKDQGYKDFYYPATPLSCTKSTPHNIVFITLEEWSAEEFNGFATPQIWHIAGHGQTYTNHYSGGNNTQEGLFSLFYSLPPAYLLSALSEGKESVFSAALKNSNYVVRNVNTSTTSDALSQFITGDKEDSLESMESFLTERVSSLDEKPFFLNILLGNTKTLAEKDQIVRYITDAIQAKKLLDTTLIVLTGTHGAKQAHATGMTVEELKTPLVVIWPDLEPGVVDTYTAHYDVVPTIMKEEWKCKNKTADYSFGSSLLSKEPRNIHVAGDYKQLGILDFNVKTLTTIGQQSGLEVRDFNLKPYPRSKVDEAKVLNALEKLTYFFRKH